MKWTSKNETQIQEMFENGISATIIAKKFGTTRSTILGKLNRLGLRRSTVQQYLGLPTDWPVVEKVKHEIVLMPNAADIKTATKGDPRACALHNAACRVFDVPNCAIGGRWAYIPQRDKTGKHYIARVQAPKETQDAIHHFDKTGEMPTGGFRFIPIAKSHRYKAKNAYNKKHRKVATPADKKRKLTKRHRVFRSMPTGLRID